MIEIDHVLQTPMVMSFDADRGAEKRPNPPDPMRKREVISWDCAIARWVDRIEVQIRRHYPSQTNAVQMMKAEISDNVESGHNLTVTVWSDFLDHFYGLERECRDQYFCNLLGMMMDRGSNVVPTAETFSVILFGTMMKSDIANHRSTAPLILNELMHLCMAC